MTQSGKDKYSAGEQGLGYIYQPRLALLKILELPEDSGILIEADDDLEFVGEGGERSLASLKHKAQGDRLTDLATDFWKSLRIWLERYTNAKTVLSDLRFFLFTTGTVSDKSFLRYFQQQPPRIEESLIDLIETVMASSTAKIIQQIQPLYDKLTLDEKQDFFDRITIFDNSPRISDIPKLIMDRHLRTVPRSFRIHVLERLEGWWQGVAIQLLEGERTTPVYGYEISDKLSNIAEEYRSDNLPITFRNKRPEGGIDAENDPRLFVRQLRILGVPMDRIQNAIIDYYRAFEQRSSWARESLLVSDEMENYEDLLVEEWGRYKSVIFEDLDDESEEHILIRAGKELLKWAEFETERLRIRERVTEPYVVRGAFHILANDRPSPRVHWHPRFLDRIEALLETPE